MKSNSYPPLNMHFVVEFQRKDLVDDMNFQSVQGLQVRVNKFEGKSRVHYENIILKRAYEPDSKIVSWCMDVIKNRKKQPVNLTIKLLNAAHEPVSAWNIKGALPVGWGVEELNAQETKILIETIELKPLSFDVLNSNGKVTAKEISQLKFPIENPKKI